MTNHEHAVAVFGRYAEAITDHDAAAISRLFSDVAIIEDPAGAPIITGRPAIDERSRRAAATESMVLTGDVYVAGRVAAAPMRSTFSHDGHRQTIDVIDVFEFDEQGLIIRLTAIWGDGNRHDIVSNEGT